MRSLLTLLAVLALTIPDCVAAQQRTVAMTFDDLPFASGSSGRMSLQAVRTVNGKILDALRRRHVPATGFVVQTGVEDIGMANGRSILREWTSQGFDLGNHTYSHPDISDLSIEQIEDEIVLGETSFAPLMREVHKRPEFFRFPYNDTGDTKEKHDAIADFLKARGYTLAPCTIDNMDYWFNAAYVVMLARHDDASSARLRSAYLAYTKAELDWYSALDKQVFGYEPPHIMLLHDSQLNADVIDDVLNLFAGEGYRFVTLKQAETDPAYHVPETYITKYGVMWGYRWAKELNVKVSGKLEPVPPDWVDEYRKKWSEDRP